jgi:hypothetical protein
MWSRVLAFLRDESNREALSWLGGGIVAVASAIWAVVKFRAERKKDDAKKSGDTNVTQSGQGFGLVRDQIFEAPVTFGPSKEYIEQIQKPLADQLDKKDAQITALSNQIAALTKFLLEKYPGAVAGAVVVAGLSAVFPVYVHYSKPSPPPTATVAQQGTGIASGRDTNVNAPVTADRGSVATGGNVSNSTIPLRSAPCRSRAHQASRAHIAEVHLALCPLERHARAGSFL